jgi:hypothetical protein
LRARIAVWSGIAAAHFKHARIAQYRSGTQLGWHRDVANFESVVGVSRAGAALGLCAAGAGPLGLAARSLSHKDAALLHYFSHTGGREYAA